MVARVEDGLRSPFEREPELVALIGQVIVVWGAINHLMRTIGMQVFDCDYDETDKRLSKSLGEGARIEMLISSIREGDRVQLRSILTRLKDTTERRNLIVHGGPLFGFRAGVFERGMHIVNFKQPDPQQRFHAAMPYVQAHLEEIRGLGAELFDCANGIGASVDQNKLSPYAGPPEVADAS